MVDDTDLTWTLQLRGQSAIGATMYADSLAIPIITGTLVVVVFIWSLYDIQQSFLEQRARQILPDPGFPGQ